MNASSKYGSNPDQHAKLLTRVKAGELAKDLKQAASELLMLSRDRRVREEAQGLFAAAGGDLPPVVELIKRKGDPARGEKLFATKTCIVCHQAGKVGINKAILAPPSVWGSRGGRLPSKTRPLRCLGS